MNELLTIKHFAHQKSARKGMNNAWIAPGLQFFVLPSTFSTSRWVSSAPRRVDYEESLVSQKKAYNSRSILWWRKETLSIFKNAVCNQMVKHVSEKPSGGNNRLTRMWWEEHHRGEIVSNLCIMKRASLWRSGWKLKRYCFPDSCLHLSILWLTELHQNFLHAPCFIPSLWLHLSTILFLGPQAHTCCSSSGF